MLNIYIYKFLYNLLLFSLPLFAVSSLSLSLVWSCNLSLIHKHGPDLVSNSNLNSNNTNDNNNNNDNIDNNNLGYRFQLGIIIGHLKQQTQT